MSFHRPDCSGCPHCSAVARALLANPHNPVLIETMGNSRLRALAEPTLRAAEGTARPRTASTVEPTANQWIAEGIRRLSTLEGRRHSADDQQLVQDLHDVSAKLGAEHDPDSDRTDPIQTLHDKAVSLGADCSDDPEEQWETADAKRKAGGPGQATALEARHAMRTLGDPFTREEHLRFEADHATLRARPVRTRVVEVPDAPDPYAAGRARTAPLDPRNDASYSPRGNPADGHFMALSAAADSFEVPSEPSDTPGYSPTGTPPDGYALALRAAEMRKEDHTACKCKRS